MDAFMYLLHAVFVVSMSLQLAVSLEKTENLHHVMRVNVLDFCVRLSYNTTHLLLDNETNIAFKQT
jgi:hypothetical protein